MDADLVDLDEFIEFGLSDDGSHLSDEQHAAPAVQQQRQGQYDDDAIVVENLFDEESMQSPVVCYMDANNTTTDESHQPHDNNNITLNSQEFLLLNPHQYYENDFTSCDDYDINVLEEHLLDEDNEMLADDYIIIEDETATRILNEGEVIEPDLASTGYETGYEIQKLTQWDPLSSYIQMQAQSKNKNLHDADNDAGDDVDHHQDDILQDFSNDCIEDREVEIEEASEAEGATEIIDDNIIEHDNVFEFVSTTNITISDDDDDGDDVEIAIGKELTTGVGDNSPSSSLRKSVRKSSTELQQQQQDVKSYTTRTRIPIIATSQRSPNSKRKHIEEYTGHLRYMLYDNLIATIVDFDADETPIVEFSMSTSKSDDSLPVECGVCAEVMTRSKLPFHNKTHQIPETNRYACIYCEKDYGDIKYLACHARRHMGIRPYVCKKCELYFSTKQDLRMHNQRRHNKKKHVCEICGKNFAHKYEVRLHRESLHENKRRFQCPECPKGYFKNFSLQEHIRSVHMGKRRMLVCLFCGMKCYGPRKMAKHRKENHLNQSVYRCEVCCEEFTDIYFFDAHKRSIQCKSNMRHKKEEEDADNGKDC